MNNILRTLLAFSTIGISSVCASQLDPIRVSVPFSFTAGKTSLPAGDYTIFEQDSKVIMILGARGSAMVLSATGERDAQEKSGLSFRRTDKGYFLESVHSAGKPMSMIPVSEEGQK